MFRKLTYKIYVFFTWVGFTSKPHAYVFPVLPACESKPVTQFSKIMPQVL